jgi:8-oxo-dGTP pyrophosphatase MutT (NUDIX family)
MFAERIIRRLGLRTPAALTGDWYKPAAVLVPVQELPRGDHLVLTKRAEHLRTHKGQIAFPGGRVDPQDVDVVATALRECHEEVGIHPECVRVLGALDQFTAGYGLVVTPVIGLIPAECEFLIDPRETTEVASVPIAALMNPDTFVVGDQLSPGGHPNYHFYVNGWDVWGVTARIIVQLLEIAYDFRVETSDPVVAARL